MSQVLRILVPTNAYPDPCLEWRSTNISALVHDDDALQAVTDTKCHWSDTGTKSHQTSNSHRGTTNDDKGLSKRAGETGKDIRQGRAIAMVLELYPWAPRKCWQIRVVIPSALVIGCVKWAMLTTCYDDARAYPKVFMQISSAWLLGQYLALKI